MQYSYEENSDYTGSTGFEAGSKNNDNICQIESEKVNQPFVFYDYRGNRCGRANCFYDSEGNCVSWGDGFYDGEGYRNWGDNYYDSRGYFRSWGECFYDTKGNIVYLNQ